METEPLRRGRRASGRTGRSQAAGTAVGYAASGVCAPTIGALLAVRGGVSAVLPFLVLVLDSGGAGKDPYNCIMLSGVGDGVKRTGIRSGSMYPLERDASAREASNIFASRTTGLFRPSPSAVAVGGGVGMPYSEWSESERSSL